MNKRLTAELGSFKDLFKGGYYEGDPLQPLSSSGYKQLGYISTLHATYLRCIKPYVNSQTIALEIGPGRGAWTKALLASQEVVVLDALSAEHNRFFEYLGNPKNVKYFQVKDFACEMLPDRHFDYMFSYGCFCHVSFEGITEYAANIYPKLKPDSNCFWMVADYDKYDRAVSNLKEWSIYSAIVPRSRKYLLLQLLFRYLMMRERPHKAAEHDRPVPGRWHHAGIERTCRMLEQVGYHIVDPDVGTCVRDPIIHFVKS